MLKKRIIPCFPVTIRSVENICKTQAQLGNRWWGANWKSTPLFNQSLKTFAELIRITYDDTYTVSGAPLHRTESVHPVDNAHGNMIITDLPMTM